MSDYLHPDLVAAGIYFLDDEKMRCLDAVLTEQAKRHRGDPNGRAAQKAAAAKREVLEKRPAASTYGRGVAGARAGADRPAGKKRL